MKSDLASAVRTTCWFCGKDGADGCDCRSKTCPCESCAKRRTDPEAFETGRRVKHNELRREPRPPGPR